MSARRAIVELCRRHLLTTPHRSFLRRELFSTPYVWKQWYSNIPSLTESERTPIDRRLQLTFTCKICTTRSTHEFAKTSYDHGIVLIQCPGCENRHLIADRLGWFKDNPGGVGLDEILKDKGNEVVKKGRLAADGTIEYYDTH